MGLVPVRDVIVRGYTFLFARFFTVIGLGWLSAAFYGIACTYLIRAVSSSAANAVPANGAFNQYSMLYFLALLVVTAFFGAPMLIPFTRESLGMHEEPVAAHFSYGPREWRLFVALLRFYGMVLATLFILIVASSIGIAQLSQSHVELLGTPLASWLSTISAFVVLGVLAFLSVRLGFFLPPMAAVEGHAGIARAWALSRRNFWRLAAVYLAVVIPVALIVLISEYALWGAELDPANAGAKAIFALQYKHADSIAAMLAIALMAMSALFAACSAAAYSTIDTTLAEESETEPSAPESNWGINRAPAYADAGHNHERFEPRQSEPHYDEPQQPDSMAPAAYHPEPQQYAEPMQVISEPVVPEPVMEQAHASAALDIPAEAPTDSGHAADDMAIATEAATRAASDSPPPLDPVGLAAKRDQAA